jgi:hypothetical protein
MIRRQVASPAEPLPDKSAGMRESSIAGLDTEDPLEERTPDSSTSLDSTAKEGKVSGRLWDPLLGLSEHEVEEWERQGKFVNHTSLVLTHHQSRKSRGVASISG